MRPVARVIERDREARGPSPFARFLSDRARAMGPRAAADPRRHPGLPDVAGDARAGAPLAAPRAAGCDERARHDCHLGARRHADGVRVFTADDGSPSGRRPLERECVGHVCKVGNRRTGRARTPAALRAGRGGRRMDHGSQYLSDHFLTLRYWSMTLASSKSGNQRGRRALESTLKEQASTAGSFETSPRCARPSPSSSIATTSAGASRSWRIARRSKRAKNTSYAMPRSANVCPRNRVRYTFKELSDEEVRRVESIVVDAFVGFEGAVG